MIGKVTLVGAGPGGKALLTLGGLHAIEQAEVVVYDRLVSQEILELIPKCAERIDVGKQNHHHPVPQEQIHKILVEKARAGRQVVRLKGGDCYLFGRGGEECEVLQQEGVPFEVIPGITSALAVPAYAGIPVTHREYCSSVHIITAHAQAGKKLEIPFAELVNLQGTLVFLMGLSALPILMQELMNAGMSPNMPAAVIANGARGNQKKVVAQVSTLAASAEMLESPALIVVGQVCTLHEKLDWFSMLPLHGKTVVVTRPQERSGTLSDRLRDLGANVVECPCIETIPIDNGAILRYTLEESAWDWIVLTSPAGVAAMVNGLLDAGMDLRILYGAKFAVIGAATASALKQYGICADFMPEHYDSIHLADGLVERIQAGERVLLLRSAQGGDELPKRLRKAEIPFADIATYETVYCTEYAAQLQEMLGQGKVDVVTFTSASTVQGFLQAVAPQKLDTFTALCIGEQTAQVARDAGMQVKVSAHATIDSMIERLMEE